LLLLLLTRQHHIANLFIERQHCHLTA